MTQKDVNLLDDAAELIRILGVSVPKNLNCEYLLLSENFIPEL